MVPHLRRVVAGGATPWDRRQADHVVEPAHAGDVDALAVEERLAACDRGARLVEAVSAQTGPVGEERHRVLIERLAGRVGAERVVDAEMEGRAAQLHRATPGAL